MRNALIEAGICELNNFQQQKWNIAFQITRGLVLDKESSTPPPFPYLKSKAMKGRMGVGGGKEAQRRAAFINDLLCLVYFI